MEELGFGPKFALASLATWRITHLLAEEDGPADVVVRLRARLGSGQLGSLMDCFYCLSVWVAAPLGLLVARRPREAPLTWLALSGAACLLERATEPEQGWRARAFRSGLTGSSLLTSGPRGALRSRDA
jgi:Protein of unknown function (DUF1360)